MKEHRIMMYCVWSDAAAAWLKWYTFEKLHVTIFGKKKWQPIGTYSWGDHFTVTKYHAEDRLEMLKLKRLADHYGLKIPLAPGE